MPKITKNFQLEVTPEQFVNACDDVELQELQIELDRRLGCKINKSELPQYCVSHPMICDGLDRCQECI
ncbi:MAG TPA: hypothetical protein EYO36_10420 [Mesonia sp.]|nr:hypothetical protein [Mesonia sp.]